MENKIVNKFPQNFFTNLTPYIPTLNEKKHDSHSNGVKTF